jgi:hypothetical protein
MAGWNAAEELKELFRSGDSGLAAFRTKLNSELYTLGFGCQELLHGNYTEDDTTVSLLLSKSKRFSHVGSRIGNQRKMGTAWWGEPHTRFNLF